MIPLVSRMIPLVTAMFSTDADYNAINDRNTVFDKQNQPGFWKRIWRLLS
jgi:hypothetical protein